MEGYYNILMREGSVEIPKEQVMTFMMFCYLQGLLGFNVRSEYTSESTKKFIFD